MSQLISTLRRRVALRPERHSQLPVVLMDRLIVKAVFL